MLDDERAAVWRTPERKFRYLGFIICIILGVALGIWHNLLLKHHRADPVESVVRLVTRPTLKAGHAVTQWLDRQVGWLFSGKTMAAENQRLRTQVAALKAQVAALQEADVENQQLRSALNFVNRFQPHPLGADVIAVRPNPLFNTLVVDAGSAEGVKTEQAVVVPQGLVGQVYAVSRNSADVLMLTDTSSAVGVMVQRAGSRAIGIGYGTGAPQLQIKNLPPKTDIKVGDTIVSSGLGGVYPKGLIVGQVTSIVQSRGGFSERAFVQPAVDFNRLEQVYILR
ncbi:MAG: rod shape-determining protein MreC [Armatimonadetes bacterium]|nr:rod shape-determining protein MreC [Armatimonadota bacterium]